MAATDEQQHLLVRPKSAMGIDSSVEDSSRHVSTARTRSQRLLPQQLVALSLAGEQLVDDTAQQQHDAAAASLSPATSDAMATASSTVALDKTPPTPDGGSSDSSTGGEGVSEETPHTTGTKATTMASSSSESASATESLNDSGSDDGGDHEDDDHMSGLPDTTHLLHTLPSAPNARGAKHSLFGLRATPSTTFGLRAPSPGGFGLRATTSTWGLRALVNTVPRVRVQVVTYNMNSKTLRGAPEGMFLNRDKEPSPDMYVIGSQETGSFKEWKEQLQEVLGAGYVRLASHSLMQIGLVVFVRKMLRHRCGHVHKDAVPTGVGNMLGNKGGVAIAFKFDDTRLLFVTAHFAAHEKMLAQRNADFHRINKFLFMPKTSARPLLNAMSFRTAVPKPPTRVVPVDTSTRTATESTGAMDTYPPLASHTHAHPGSQPLSPMSPPTRTSVHATAAPPIPEDAPAAEDTPPPTTTTHSSTATPSCTNAPPAGGAGVSAGGADVSAGGASVSAGGASTAASTTAGTPGAPQSTASEKHDIVFWFGDLNYRLVCHRVLVESAINSKQLPLLLQADQLLQEMKKGIVFEGFVEAPITFSPTYKFNAGTNTYDTSAKQRTPSWTDRVLWRCNAALPVNAVQLHTYTSLPGMMVSDHKPVVAEFTITLRKPDVSLVRHGSQVFGEVLRPSRWCGCCCGRSTLVD